MDASQNRVPSIRPAAELARAEEPIGEHAKAMEGSHTIIIGAQRARVKEGTGDRRATFDGDNHSLAGTRWRNSANGRTKSRSGLSKQEKPKRDLKDFSEGNYFEEKFVAVSR